MGDIVPPSSYTKKDFLIAKIGSKHLKFSIYETENLVNIYIGGPRLFCIHTTVNKENSIFVQRGLFDKATGTIEKIYYNQQCSLEHDFARGVDTNMIIYLLCQYIKDTYKYVTHLKFNDASSRTCDNGTDVSLAAMTYLYSEKTWYQKNFYAIMAPDYVARFNEIIKKFNEEKEKYSWDAFNEIFIKGKLPLSENKMKVMYDSAATWIDFFKPLMADQGIAKFCNFLSPWLSQFIKDILKYDFMKIPYMFVLSDLPAIDYTLSPFIAGGSRRKFTRKNKRRPPRNEM